MPNSVLISGINGQDGIFLSRELINHGFEVYGIGTRAKPSPFLDKRVKYIQCDIRDTNKVFEVCEKYYIHSFFNLAAVSSVSQSFDEVELTREINFLAPVRILERFSHSDSKVKRFFQASSSEMFGDSKKEPQDEETSFNPLSPYAEWKAEMHIACESRRSDGYFATCAILYNHESIYRPINYLSKKIARSVAELYFDKSVTLKLGNIHSERDWGFAGDYMFAVRKMMSLDSPETLVIATGKCHSVIDMVSAALNAVDLIKYMDEFVVVDETLFRPREANRLVGNPNKAYTLLDWTPAMSFDAMIKGLVLFEIEALSQK